MSRIRINNIPIKAKLVKPEISKEYIKITEEVDERIKERRKQEGRTYIKARDFIVR